MHFTRFFSVISRLSRRRAVIIAATAIITAFFVFQAPAQEADTYTISGVTVSKKAESGEKAREAAVAEAERKAFRKLMEKLAPGRADEAVADMPQERISSLVTEMRVRNERVSSVFYSAEFTFSFHPGMARAIAGGEGGNRGSVFGGNRPQGVFGGGRYGAQNERERLYGYPPEEQGSVYNSRKRKQDGPVMVLPVLEEGGAARQWEKSNAWIRSWRAMSSRGLFYVVPSRAAPILHPSMLEYIRLGNLTEEDRLRIVRFLQPYGPSDFSYMIYGQYRYDPQAQSAVVEATLYEIAPEFRSVLEHRVRMGIGEEYERFIERASQEVFDIVRPYIGTGGDTQTQQAYNDIDRMEKYGDAPADAPACDRTATTPPFVERITVTAFSLPEWLNIKQKLESADGIVGVSSVSLSPGRMIVDVAHQCKSGYALSSSVASVGLSYDPGESVIFMPQKAGYSPY